VTPSLIKNLAAYKTVLTNSSSIALLACFLICSFVETTESKLKNEDFPRVQWKVIIFPNAMPGRGETKQATRRCYWEELEINRCNHSIKPDRNFK
jgi:hypothetical protein